MRQGASYPKPFKTPTIGRPVGINCRIPALGQNASISPSSMHNSLAAKAQVEQAEA